MYEIYAGSTCIFSDVSPDPALKVAEATLDLTAGGAGSLSLRLPPTNAGYSLVQRMTTDIAVKRNGVQIWAGRPLTESRDFWNNRELLCEGELAFLNDTTQPPMKYTASTISGFLSAILTVHNAKVAESRRFVLGNVTVTDPLGRMTRVTNYETTWDCIEQKLVGELGGFLRVRKVGSIRYLDYLANYPSTCSQTIEFGKNLLDFTRNWDSTDFATVLLPRGATLEESTIPEIQAYTTVESVNDGSPYVQSDSAVAAYGWIEKVVDFSDIESPSELLTEARRYLTNEQFGAMTLELSALDLQITDPSTEGFELLDKVRVISRPHGMDRMFAAVGIKIPLTAPENTTYTFGDASIAYRHRAKTLTRQNRQDSAGLNQRIDELPTAQEILTDASEYTDTELAEARVSILEVAREEAAEMMNKKTTGYITIVSGSDGTDALYISDTRDYRSAANLWKWTMSGLGFSKDGGSTYEVAITMDGKIVANFITAGEMLADRVKLYGDMDVYYSATDATPSGSIGFGKGRADSGDTNGIHMYVGNNEVFCSPYAARMSSGTNRVYVSSSGFYVGTALYPTDMDVRGDTEMHGDLWVTGDITGPTITDINSYLSGLNNGYADLDRRVSALESAASS